MIVAVGVCLAGWSDHPRRAVDDKREETARADLCSVEALKPLNRA
jgi:hypothetical protein